jgi:hypothetical protein
MIDSEIDAIQRALREITHILDSTVAKVLKGILERQARVFSRVSVLESQVNVLLAALREKP